MMKYKRIIELLQQRSDLDNYKVSISTAETLNVSDDPKKPVAVPLDNLRGPLRDVIDSAIVLIDGELAELGVVLKQASRQ